MIRTLLFFLTLTTVPTVGTAAGGDPIRLPDFGSTADTLLSAREERELGRAFMQNVRKSLPVLEDPLLDAYLQDLGERLAAASGAATDHFHFFFIDEPVVNAFAGPDGYIGVYAGLVLATQSEAELAAVLAHEIAHVTQRHLLRSLEDQRRMTGPTMALLIAAALLGAQVDGNLGAAALAGVQAAALQHQINFTRHNEEEADRIGITALAEAGFDPYAMPGFFKRLARASRTDENSAPEFLRTHPVTPNRIADALARADDHGHIQRPDTLRYHLARARLRELGMKSGTEAIAYFKSHLASGRYRNRTAETYGYALALAREHRTADAQRLARELLDRFPNQVAFILLDARMDAERGAMDRALRKLRTAVGLRPDNLPLRMAYGEILIRAGQARRALATLENLLRFQPGTPALYAQMEEAALKSGRRAAVHRYRGEKLYRQGDLKAAIRQMELALRAPNLGFHEAAVIRARLQALRAEEADRKDAKGKGRSEAHAF